MGMFATSGMTIPCLHSCALKKVDKLQKMETAVIIQGVKKRLQSRGAKGDKIKY
jgi:hypothetical protein